MQRQVNSERKNVKKFWDISGAFLNKSAYQTSIDRDLSQSEVDQKLDEVDETFKNKNPAYTPDYACYHGIPEDQKYELNTDPTFIKDQIVATKKLQPFFLRSCYQY